jgi:hypothetical protein
MAEGARHAYHSWSPRSRHGNISNTVGKRVANGEHRQAQKGGVDTECHAKCLQDGDNFVCLRTDSDSM